MNQYILIDGENFVHGIVHVLRSKKMIRNRDQLHKIDMATILDDIKTEPNAVRYYSTRIQVPSAESSLHDAIEKMRQWNAKWTPYLANQEVRFIKAGILKARSSKRCPHCHKKTEILLEKGVDVRIGVDIVSLGQNKAKIYILSSDSDIIPAVSAARANGARIIYVAIEGSINRGLSKSANQTIILKKAQIHKAYKKANP